MKNKQQPKNETTYEFSLQHYLEDYEFTTTYKDDTTKQKKLEEINQRLKIFDQKQMNNLFKYKTYIEESNARIPATREKIEMLQQVIDKFTTAYLAKDETYFDNKNNQYIVELLFSLEEPIITKVKDNKKINKYGLAAWYWDTIVDNDHINQIILSKCRGKNFNTKFKDPNKSAASSKNHILSGFLANAAVNIPDYTDDPKYEVMEKNLKFLFKEAVRDEYLVYMLEDNAYATQFTKFYDSMKEMVTSFPSLNKELLERITKYKSAEKTSEQKQFPPSLLKIFDKNKKKDTKKQWTAEALVESVIANQEGRKIEQQEIEKQKEVPQGNKKREVLKLLAQKDESDENQERQKIEQQEEVQQEIIEQKPEAEVINNIVLNFKDQNISVNLLIALATNGTATTANITDTANRTKIFFNTGPLEASHQVSVELGNKKFIVQVANKESGFWHSIELKRKVLNNGEISKEFVPLNEVAVSYSIDKDPDSYKSVGFMSCYKTTKEESNYRTVVDYSYEELDSDESQGQDSNDIYRYYSDESQGSAQDDRIPLLQTNHLNLIDGEELYVAVDCGGVITNFS